MNVTISAVRPFSSDCRVELISLDVQNDDAEMFAVIVSGDKLEASIAAMDSGEIIYLSELVLLPWPLYFDPDD